MKTKIVNVIYCCKCYDGKRHSYKDVKGRIFFKDNKGRVNIHPHFMPFGVSKNIIFVLNLVEKFKPKLYVHIFRKIFSFRR